MKSVITNSFEETQKIAEDFAKTLKGGEVILLYGDLGFGKTTFTQGLAKGLGAKRNVNSPTFIIMRTYELPDNKMLYHVDLYRLQYEQEIIDIGLPDIMHKPEAIVVIEWPEKLGKILPKERIEIVIEHIADTERKITITPYA